MTDKKGEISIFIRGGNWNNTTNAGVFSLNLNNDASNANTNIGFRSGFTEYSIIVLYMAKSYMYIEE
jgi:hypothetical protein